MKRSAVSVDSGLLLLSGQAGTLKGTFYGHRQTLHHLGRRGRDRTPQWSTRIEQRSLSIPAPEFGFYFLFQLSKRNYVVPLMPSLLLSDHGVSSTLVQLPLSYLFIRSKQARAVHKKARDVTFSRPVAAATVELGAVASARAH